MLLFIVDKDAVGIDKPSIGVFVVDGVEQVEDLAANEFTLSIKIDDDFVFTAVAVDGFMFVAKRMESFGVLDDGEFTLQLWVLQEEQFFHSFDSTIIRGIVHIDNVVVGVVLFGYGIKVLLDSAVVDVPA